MREIFFAVFARFSISWAPAAFFGNMLVWITGAAFLVYVLITIDYHMKHVGRSESWRLLAWTLAIEFAIVLTGYFMT